MPNHPEPPWIGRLLLRLCRLGLRRDEVETDLLELFRIRAADRGRTFARRRYVADVLSLWTWHGASTTPAARPGYGGFPAITQDVVFAARLFRRQPVLFGLTVAGLAVAMGITTATFGIVRRVAFAGYGVSSPESVVRVASIGGPFTRTTGNSPYQGNWAFSDFVRLKEAATSMTTVAAVSTTAEFRADRDHGDPLRVGVMAVTGDYFSVLGFRARVGRMLTPADDRTGVSSLVVSHGFWKNQLGSDPAILGRTIWLDDYRLTVIGVADKRHGSPSYASNPPAFWTTVATHVEMLTGRSRANLEETRARLQALSSRPAVDAAERSRLKALEAELTAPSRSNPAVDVLGRIGRGVTRARAEAEVGAIAVALAGEHRSGGTSRPPTVQLQSIDDIWNKQTIPLVAILMTTVGAVVLLACANVTNLLLASATSRRREIGTRLAIGASRGRIVRQMLTESLLLGLLGGALGLLIAIQILPSLAALVQIPPAFDVSPDFAVHAFVAMVALAVGLIAGLAPARFGGRGDVLSALNTDQHAAPRPMPRGFLRSLLIGGQAAVSIVLLVLAALLTRALVQTAALDLGYNAERLMTVAVGSGSNRRFSGAADTADYWRAALARILQVPGVARAGLVSVPPFDSVTASQLLNGRRINRNETSPEFFDTLGARLIRGRIYTADEVAIQAPVAVISARLAREFWGSEDPVGASLERVWGEDDASSTRVPGLLSKPKGTRIIGVVTDVITGLRHFDAPTIYLPLANSAAARLVVRAHDDPRAIAPAVRDALESLDPTTRARTVFPSDGLKREREGPRILAALAVMVGSIALGLAIIGLFGVTAFAVEQRTHEVSVRRALGAGNSQLVRMLLNESLKPVAVGLAFGLLLALLGGRVVQSVLYGVNSRDPIAILAAVAILLAAAAAAVVLPARRAMRVDPAQLLKTG
jgi:putative ABC transport system permease protein